MTPLTVFVRTLMKTSAIFIGATVVFLHPRLDWSASGGARAQRGPADSIGVTAGQSSAEAAIDGLVGALKDSDAGVRRQAAAALGQLGSPRAVPGAHRGAQGLGPGDALARDRRAGRARRSRARPRPSRARSRTRRPTSARAPRWRSASSAIARRSMRSWPPSATRTPTCGAGSSWRSARSPTTARLPALTAALKDEDAGVRRAAIQAIAETGRRRRRRVTTSGSGGMGHPNPNPESEPESQSRIRIPTRGRAAAFRPGALT